MVGFATAKVAKNVKPIVFIRVHTFNTVTRSIHWMLLVMPLSVDLTSAGNNTPESKLGIVCTPSWTLNTKKLEETNEPHFIAACNSLVPIFS